MGGKDQRKKRSRGLENVCKCMRVCVHVHAGVCERVRVREIAGERVRERECGRESACERVRVRENAGERVRERECV